jgi:hypothetical protein
VGLGHRLAHREALRADEPDPPVEPPEVVGDQDELEEEQFGAKRHVV